MCIVCLRKQQRSRAGSFSSGLNSSLEHPWNIIAKLLKHPEPAYFRKERLFYILWENLLFSEPYNERLLECNLGERGEGWQEREDIFTSGHRESRVVWEQGDMRHAMRKSQVPLRADLLMGTENWVTEHHSWHQLQKEIGKLMNTFSLNYSLWICHSWMFLKFYRIFSHFLLFCLSAFVFGQCD